MDMYEDLENGEFDPEYESEEETIWSLRKKWVASGIMAFVRVACNIPIFIFGVVGVASWIATNYGWTAPGWLNWVDWEHSIYVYLFVLLWQRVKGLARKYIAMPMITPIWAANFVPSIKNPGYSRSKEKEYEQLYRLRNQTQLAEIEAEYNQKIELLKEETNKNVRMLKNTATFPDEFFSAIVRMVDLITCARIANGHPRYHYVSILENLLSEICSSENIPFVHQATIYIENPSGELEIIASRNLKESVVLSRKIKPGEEFTGNVFQSDENVWLFDLDSVEAREYGFDTKARPYQAIAGFPIKGLGTDSYNIGVISLHFREKINFQTLEQENIHKMLDVVKQLVLFTLYSHKVENNGILISKPNVDWGVQVAATTTMEHEKKGY